MIGHAGIELIHALVDAFDGTLLPGVLDVIELQLKRGPFLLYLLLDFGTLCLKLLPEIIPVVHQFLMECRVALRLRALAGARRLAYARARMRT